MAPPQLSVIKRELQQTKLELHKIKKLKKSGNREKLAKAPKIGTFWLPMFVGPQKEQINIHSNSVPQTTLDYLDTRRMTESPIFIALPEQCPEMVKLYQLYSYTGKLFSEYPEDQTPDEHVKINADAEWSRLANMYFLGLTFRDEKFANKVIDSIVEKVEEDPDELNYPTGIATEVYENTTWGDPLRRLIVDLHVWIGKGQGIDEPHQDAHGPGDFLRNVLAAMSAAGKAVYEDDAKAPWELSTCKFYHKHVHTEVCGGEGAEVIDLTDA